MAGSHQGLCSVGRVWSWWGRGWCVVCMWRCTTRAAELCVQEKSFVFLFLSTGGYVLRKYARKLAAMKLYRVLKSRGSLLQARASGGDTRRARELDSWGLTCHFVFVYKSSVGNAVKKRREGKTFGYVQAHSFEFRLAFVTAVCSILLTGVPP